MFLDITLPNDSRKVKGAPLKKETTKVRPNKLSKVWAKAKEKDKAVSMMAHPRNSHKVLFGVFANKDKLKQPKNKEKGIKHRSKDCSKSLKLFLMKYKA